MTTPVATLDQQRTLYYLANRKSTGVAYLFWFFLGMLGAHRFYAGRTGTGIAMLLLTSFGILLSFLFIGLFVLVIPGIWFLIDALLIPGMIADHNGRLALGVAR